MNTTNIAATAGQDFDTAWRETFTRHRDLIALLQTMIALTGAGADPVAVEELAARLGRSLPETERLFAEVAPGGTAWANMSLDDGLAYFDMGTASSRPRFRYHLGGRVVGADGCAPDIFLIAFALRQLFHVEAACPATGTPIRVEFDTGGVTATSPDEAVVAMIHPQTAPEAFALTDKAKIDTDICLQQPFFASNDAAAEWLATHPGGKVFAPAAFYRHLDQIVSDVPASRPTS